MDRSFLGSVTGDNVFPSGNAFKFTRGLDPLHTFEVSCLEDRSTSSSRIGGGLS